jgi:uncharacterized membrane protein
MDETPMGTPGMPNPQPPAAPMPPAQTGRPGPASDTSKLLAAGGYIIWPVALIAILIDPYKDEPFVKFHGFQALGFGLAMTVLVTVVGFVPIVGWAIDALLPILWLVLAIVYAIKAYNGEYAEMPVVYSFVKGYVK